MAINPYIDETRIRMIVDSMPTREDRLALADAIEYLSSIADRRTNPGGMVPEGSLKAFYDRQRPAVRAALDAQGEYIRTARFAPFTNKQSEAERLAGLGLPAQMLTIVDAVDGIDVAERLEERMRKPLIPTKPSLRDYIKAEADKAEPKARMMAAAEAEVADAGASSNLPLRTHLELAREVIGSNRGIETDDDYTGRGADNDVRHHLERAVAIHSED